VRLHSQPHPWRTASLRRVEGLLLRGHLAATIGRTGIGVAPGAVVMTMIYALGPLSGLQVNPSLTLAFAGRGLDGRPPRSLGQPDL
jgi:hypothetical protein